MVAGYLTSVHFPNVTCLCLLMTELRGLGRKLKMESSPSAPFTMPHLLPEKGHCNDEFVPCVFYWGDSSERNLRGSLIFTTHSNALDHKQKLLWRFLGFLSILTLSPFQHNLIAPVSSSWLNFLFTSSAFSPPDVSSWVAFSSCSHNGFLLFVFFLSFFVLFCWVVACLLLTLGMYLSFLFLKSEL